jgi:hypothetical protein
VYACLFTLCICEFLSISDRHCRTPAAGAPAEVCRGVVFSELWIDASGRTRLCMTRRTSAVSCQRSSGASSASIEEHVGGVDEEGARGWAAAERGDGAGEGGVRVSAERAGNRSVARSCRGRSVASEQDSSSAKGRRRFGTVETGSGGGTATSGESWACF